MSEPKPGGGWCPHCTLEYLEKNPDKERVWIEESWEMRSYDGYAVWVDTANNDAFVHRHNFQFAGGTKGDGQKDRETPTQREEDLLREYFDKLKDAPASARILARKASGGDIAALRELERRFGKDQATQHYSPVQFEVSDGGQKASFDDPRPILKITKNLFSSEETWKEEPEEETPEPTVQQERSNTKPPVGTLSDPSTWDTDKARKQ